MTTFTLLGALVGCGLVTILVGAMRSGESLVEAVDRLEAAGGSPGARSADEPAALTRVGLAISTSASHIGVPLVRKEDLALLERSMPDQLSAIGLASMGLAAVGALTPLLLGLVGISLPPITSLGAAIAGLALGAVLPTSELRRKAERERSHFARALGSFLELVVMAQAGGMGVEGALMASAQACADPSFQRLRSALEQAQIAGVTPWDSLGRLGARVGIPALSELSSTLTLAGTEGARVRTTLAAKSASLRQREIAAAQARANATTERLFLPSIVLMLAFVVFLMFPAGARLAHLL
ncbi:MAG TPA: type II secretion system F family protein [Acidimicrobiales bacterium]|nr:type II secretion system F family protein [Acidimicrobiales bacterium]